MKMLISMTDFVLSEIKEPYTDSERLRVITNYEAFIKQPLELEMFVPCDEDGNVLEEPKGWSNGECDIYDCCSICCCEQYKKAKEKVLFEGFYIHYTVLFYQNQVALCDISEWETPEWMNIEWLLQNSFQDLQLTPTALKQIGL